MASKPRKPAKRSYTDRTLKLLRGCAAGRCAMPECRIELYGEATDYHPIMVMAEIAHVAAAGAQGPRAAPQMSPADKNAYDNLMLLCQIACKGRSIAMDRLDSLVTEHLVERLFQPERLAALLGSLSPYRAEKGGDAECSPHGVAKGGG